MILLLTRREESTETMWLFEQNTKHSRTIDCCYTLLSGAFLYCHTQKPTDAELCHGSHYDFRWRLAAVSILVHELPASITSAVWRHRLWMASRQGMEWLSSLFQTQDWTESSFRTEMLDTPYIFVTNYHFTAFFGFI